MQRKVRVYLTYREIISQQSIHIRENERISVNELLIQFFQILVFVNVNGRSYTNLSDKLDTDQKDRDEVAIFSPLVVVSHFRNMECSPLRAFQPA